MAYIYLLILNRTGNNDRSHFEQTHIINLRLRSALCRLVTFIRPNNGNCLKCISTVYNCRWNFSVRRNISRNWSYSRRCALQVVVT